MVEYSSDGAYWNYSASNNKRTLASSVFSLHFWLVVATVDALTAIILYKKNNKGLEISKHFQNFEARKICHNFEQEKETTNCIYIESVQQL